MAERKGDNQKLKMLYLVKIFSEETDDHHYLTMPEIIKKLERYGVNADRKTLYRDFDLLRDYGLDILTTKENRNYYYYLGSRDFELAELKLLVDSVQSAKFMTDKKSAQLIKKLESLVSKHDASKLHRQVIITGRVKADNETIYYNVDKIHDAISEDKQIRFRYYDWDLNKEMVPRYDGMWYQMSPWTLMWDDEMYYLVVYDAKHDKVTHYRVDKMKDIEILEDAREGKKAFKEFNVAHYTRTLFGMYAGEETKVILEAENNMIGVVIDRFGRDIIIAPVDDDRFRVTVSVAVSSHFLGWIMSLDGAIRIVGPDSVVKKMQGMISKLAEQYDIKQEL
ncbi:MAG: WYL domain-containing protein [Clostridiales bacterium]|nr:WYL domain-containing protein [Clostridiales bacterium]